jgi:hypothetical protein
MVCLLAWEIELGMTFNQVCVFTNTTEDQGVPRIS